MEQKELHKRFRYPAYKDGLPLKYRAIQEAAFRFAVEIIDVHCPDGREKALAITNLEQAVMWANAAIARGE